MNSYQDIIKFWFDDIDEARWFKKDDEFDALIKSKFSNIHTKATQCELFSWRDSALGILAEIIILDQFSRNMYRDNAQSFSYDSMALTLAQIAVAKKYDLELNTEQKAFLYMPFMHSESLFIHEQGVELLKKPGLEYTLNFEYKHKSIIEKFGRYPHRNKILKRESTQEELEFLLKPNSSF